MIKIISVVGARPNFMKVAPIHRAFQAVNDRFEHVICHTGQHYDANMSDAFFKDLDMPEPRFFLGTGSGSHAEQTARIMIEFEKVCLTYKPDLVIVVGDVNSTIACTLTAAKCGIKTAHIEAGLRSFDRSMPEELNRIATDSITDYCFVTEESGLINLKKEGFNKSNIFFTGNTMIDSLYYALPMAEKSNILKSLGLAEKEYVLMTIHRPSNVDEPQSLKDILTIIEHTTQYRKVVFPIHPRTLKNIELFGFKELVDSFDNFIMTEPMGYIDFLSLMSKSDFVLTDSGGIQEETTVLGVPCITARTTTERPITIKLGTNILVNPEKNSVISAIDKMIRKPRKKGTIPELWDGKAAERIVDVIANKIYNE